MSHAKPPKIMVLGCTGQVGHELCRSLQTLGHVTALDLNTAPHSIDLAQPDALRHVVRELTPDIIVNAAAYTAVDRAESEPDLARRINAEAPVALAEEARAIGATLIHYSTDYVYDGTSSTPIKESARPNPVNTYGATKLEGDRGIAAVGGRFLILRTSWVYGNRGQNFLLTMQRLARTDKPLRIINDQLGAPTWAKFLATATAQVIDRLLVDTDSTEDRSGVYHLTASGVTSWHDFAEHIFRWSLPADHSALTRLTPIPTAEYPTPAKRPHYSMLDCSRIQREFGVVCPDWRDMLQLCLAECPWPGS